MKSKVVFFLSVLILFLIFGCNPASPTEPSEQSFLEEIYQLNSQELFDQYLIKWHGEIKPIDSAEFNLLSDTQKSIYNIYQIFYDPYDLGKYCTIGICPEFGNNIYDNLKYVVVQNEIKYSINNYEDHKLISNFQPKLEMSATILYLSNEYKEEIDSFLDVDKHSNDIQKRYEFINTKLNVCPGHWGGWHYLTHPEVEMIYINESLDSAVVHFRIMYEGGEAEFRRTLDKWDMIESKLTWIE